jgi:hypothetical protein
VPNGTKELRTGAVDGGCEAEVTEIDAETDGGDAGVVVVVGGSFAVSEVDAPGTTCSGPDALPLRLVPVDNVGLAVSVLAINAS